MIFGIYRHRKGGLYLTLFTATYTEELRDRESNNLVIYVGKWCLWSRPLEMFLDGRFEKLTLRGWQRCTR